MLGREEAFASEGKKIVAIGRSYTYNWPGNRVPKPLPEPLLFIKPTTSYILDGQQVEIPQNCEVYHEVELAVVIGKKGKDIAEDKAYDYVSGYALALDMTARNIQAKAREAGLPWTICKGMDTFTPISSFIPKSLIASPSNVDLLFTVNGIVRQSGSTADLIYSVGQLIAFASSVMTLEPGDTILTGTPEGVSRIMPGDRIFASLSVSGSELASLSVDVVQKTTGYKFLL
ncbi:hypothetical protein BCR39DRAFT_513249 [Naematelia encephala]|uniref:Fumarylacetoacetase-like C-terminal domain-containing protein n=1 Tax=Naematelia encephala TaxID=71784 RepID=A0A1Y2BJ12_9TREE|nr:hypothetical protein BCR39DRAFT_513249 [Naematelia encephala]